MWTIKNYGWTQTTSISELKKKRGKKISKKKNPIIFNGPHSIDFTSNGDFYVTNYYSAEILVFDSKGFLKKKLYNKILKGPATGFFDAKGNFLISEYKLNKLVCIKANKNIIFKKISNNKFLDTKIKKKFKGPHMCKEDIDGNLIFLDTWNNRLLKINKSYEFVEILNNLITGWTNKFVKSCNKLNCPVAINFLKNGDYLITNWGNSEVLLIDKNGKLKKTINNKTFDKPYDCGFFNKNLIIANSHKGEIIIYFNQFNLE